MAFKILIRHSPTLIGWVLWREVPQAVVLGGAFLVVVAGVLAMRGAGTATPARGRRSAPVATEDLL